MPTLKEQLLKEINKNFGIVYVESLSSYEKSIYDKYHFQEKTPEELKASATEKYQTAYRNETYIGQYIASLKATDEYISTRSNEIVELQKNNLKLDEQIAAFEAEQKVKQKQIDAFQKKSDALNKKIEEIKAKAKKELEEKEKANDEKEVKRIKSYVQKRTELKTKLSDLMMEEAKYQNFLSDVTNKKYAREIVLNGLNAKSKEYAELSKEIKELDKNIVNVGSNLATLQVKLGRVQEDVDDVEEVINDQTEREKNHQEAEAAYNKALTKANPILKELLENETQKEKVSKESNIALKNIDNLSNQKYENNRLATIKDRECMNYAKDLARSQRNEASQELKEIEQYQAINNAIESKEIKITKEGTITGLKNVKIAYQDYFKKHSPIGRFFKFLPFTSAHADYADFSEVRSKYMEYSQISQTEVDHYLDNHELTGKLLEASNGLDKDYVENTLNKDAVLNKNTYKKYPGASVKDYLNAVDNIYNKELNVFQKDLGYGLLAADKGLKILNELGNIKRESSSKEVNDMIDKISKITFSFGSMGKRNSIINEEVENALKPESERRTITYDMPKNVSDLYEAAKLEEQKMYNAEENVVLFNNEVGFCKITVNDAVDKEDNAEVEEKEVIDLTDENFLDL